METNASTLHDSERRWKPFVTMFCVGTLIGGMVLVDASAMQINMMPPVRCILWAIGVLAWMLLVGSNIIFWGRNRKPSIGMLAPSMVSLGFAAFASLITTPPMWIVTLDVVLVLVGVAVAMLFCSFFARLRAAYAHLPVIADDTILIVLGGGVAFGRPRPTLARRLDAAYDVAVCHPKVTLVLTGGPTPDATTTEADVMADYLLERGVSQRQMLLERRARNTQENIVNALEIANEHGLVGPCLVVTSDYHVYRALTYAKESGRVLGGIPAPTPLPGKLQQWCREVLTILAKG